MKLSLRDYEKTLYEFGNDLSDEKKMQDVIKHLIKVIYNNTHDITMLEDLVNDYERYHESQNGVEHVWITTAQELDKSKQDEIVKDIKKILDVKDINPEFLVDSSIIGGFIMKTRDKMIDASLKAKLVGISG